jgi:hypothetical protein
MYTLNKERKTFVYITITSFLDQEKDKPKFEEK